MTPAEDQPTTRKHIAVFSDSISPSETSSTINPTDEAVDLLGDPRAPAGYVIESQLGRGGMGVVYLARSKKLNRRCALKMILSGIYSSEAEIARFHSEAQAIARLQHPNIVQIFEVGEHHDTPYMALEYCPGGSLDTLLDFQLLEPRRAAELLRTIALATHAAHQANVIHRDLKPANILLGENDIPKLTDFGLAKRLDANTETNTGSILGTPSYMPPEQAAGTKEIGPASDVYALGAILYECLASRPPFRAATPLETVNQVLHQEAVSLRQLNTKVPVDLETITHKCLQKDPAQRYATARDLADDLGRYLDGKPILARPVGVIERASKWMRRNPVVAALTSLVVLLGGVALGVSWNLTVWALQERDTARTAENLAASESKAARKAEKQAENESKRVAEQLQRSQVLLYAGQLSLAQSAFKDGAGWRAIEHLEAAQWDLRGWEHRHLWTRYHSKQKWLAHSFGLVAVAHSPNGKHMLSASQDGTVKIWEVQSGQLIRSLEPQKIVCSAGYSADGTRIVTGNHEGIVTLWAADSGKRLLAFKGHKEALQGVSFSPDGKSVAAGCQDGTAKIWDSTTGQEQQTFKGHSKELTSVAWSQDGAKLLTASEDKTAKIWSVKDGQEKRTLTGHTERVGSAAWSPDGGRIVTGSRDATVRLWDANDGQEIRTLRGHAMDVVGVAFSPDAQRILSVSYDKSAKIWEAGSGQEIHTLQSIGICACGSWSPDGRRVAIGSMEAVLQVWDAIGTQEIPTLTGHQGQILAMAFHPGGTMVATAGEDQTVRLWDANSTTELATLRENSGSVWSLAWSRDGNQLAAGGFAGEIKIWAMNTGKLLQTLPGHKGKVASIAWHPNGEQLVSVDQDLHAIIWDVAKAQVVRTLSGHQAHLTSVDWSSDGSLIVTGSADNLAKVWNAKSGLELRTLRGHGNWVSKVVFSPDGSRIVTGSYDMTAKLWNSESGLELQTFNGHTGFVQGVHFLANGQRIVTGSNDATIKIWDPTSGIVLLTLTGHKIGVSALAASRDGKRLSSGGGDKVVRIWNANKSPERLSLHTRNEILKCLAFSADSRQLLTGGTDRTVHLWSLEIGQHLRSFKGATQPIQAVHFDTPRGLVFAKQKDGAILAWDATTGQSSDATNPPEFAALSETISPDGKLRAECSGWCVHIQDRRLPGNDNSWPLPDVADRTRYHREQADQAEKQKRWFAVSYHIGRLLLDDPKNEDLMKRRESALQQWKGR
jgi:WD40 repeat protein/serine/threonine protein kinase